MNVRQYHVPSTIDKAFDLYQNEGKTRLLAGGAWLKFTKHPIDHLIDLKDLSLEGIEEKDSALEIGAMTTLRDVETHSLTCDLAGGVMTDTLNKIMGPSVRNIATIGGSVMGRFGFSDVITTLLSLNTDVVFYKRGKMSLETFLKKRPFGKDILTRIIIPENNETGYFHKTAVTHLDFATLNLCITKQNGKPRIAIGSRPQLAVLAKKSMTYLENQTNIDMSVIEEAANRVCKEVTFASDTRASGEYRKTLAYEYVSRGLKEVYGL